MCLDPGTLAAVQLALSAGEALVSYQQQAASAAAQDAQNRELERQMRLQQALEMNDIERQRQQEYQSAASEINAYALEVQRRMAAAEALLGEGATGNTANKRLASIGIQANEDLATLQSNATKTQQELGFASLAAQNRHAQRLASLRAPDRPSLLGTALTIGGAGLQYGRTLNELKNPKPSATVR